MDSVGFPFALQEEDRLSLVMECMEGGELFDRVREKKVYSEKDTWHEKHVVQQGVSCESL